MDIHHGDLNRAEILYQVSEIGQVQALGEIIPVEPQGYVVKWQAGAGLFTNSDTYFAGLSYKPWTVSWLVRRRVASNLNFWQRLLQLKRLRLCRYWLNSLPPKTMR